MDLHIGILWRSNVTISLSIGRQRKNAIDLYSGEKKKTRPAGTIVQQPQILVWIVCNRKPEDIRVSSPSLAIFFAVVVEPKENHEMKNPRPARPWKSRLSGLSKTIYDILPIHSRSSEITSRATKSSSVNYIELRSGEVKGGESRREQVIPSERIDRQFADKRKGIETRGEEKEREEYRRVVEKVRTGERGKCSFRCVAKGVPHGRGRLPNS